VSGPHDFTVRKGALSSGAHLTSTASRPAFVTIASRPFVWDGTAKDMQVIWVRRERKYFLKEDWTGRHSLNCFNKIAPARKCFESVCAQGGAPELNLGLFLLQPRACLMYPEEEKRNRKYSRGCQ
jgi:hypothetical protein